MDYWRKLFPKITTNDIDEFTLKYRFSDDERADVIKAYVSYKGDMKKVVNSIMCSNEEDLERFASMIDSEIQNGKIETFPKYKSFVNKKKKKKRTKKKKKENSMDALRAAILQRQKNTQALAKSNKKTKRHRESDLRVRPRRVAVEHVFPLLSFGVLAPWTEAVPSPGGLARA